MKLLVCCFIIVANISNNGKASLDRFSPASNKFLFEDITKNSDKSCHRPCKFNVKPRRCYYNFKIELSILEDERPVLTINGLSPGPPISVCVNDVVVVEVQNKIPDQDMAIHWHGVEQRGTPYMDGVPMVTQCPITYGSTYKYAFIASLPGTFFYHTDSVSHQSDGIYGSLVVNQPQPFEPHSALYDYDRIQEHTLMVAARFPQLLTANLDDISRIQPSSLLVNGEDHFKMFILPGFAYRLRLINAIAIECPVIFNIEKHEMVIIATDGRPVKPMLAETVMLYPGERMDVVVRTTQGNGGYWARMRGGGACASLLANSMFLYSGFNYTAMLEGEVSETPINASTPVSGQMVKSLKDAQLNPAVKSVYLGIDKNIVKFEDTDNDFRYMSDSLPKKPFFPASLSLRETGVIQINNKSFLYPSSLLLLRPRETPEKCLVGEESKETDLQCVQILTADVGDVIELILVNEGFGGNDSYTFHMHGHGMQVVATGNNKINKPFNKNDFLRLYEEGKILRNLKNPPIKDTITVPNKGYAISRVRLDNGGSWLLECRACSLSSLPTAVIINVPQSLPKAVIESLPKCGSYKPPDVLLN